MPYGRMPKEIDLRTKTNWKLILEIVEKQQEITLQKIADTLLEKYGISLTRERVRQIILMSELPQYINPSEGLNTIYRENRKRFIAYCKKCGKARPNISKKTEGGKLCRECSKTLNYISFKCTNCGKETTVTDSFLTASRRAYTKRGWRKNPHINFCSKTCTGQYNGIKFGFGMTRRKMSS
tara:strand:- start:4064 stop:4606 length:543 start_codon:yes stop_codon:yes gene_type:complete